ncbi:MAG: DUF2098 domain-containing protein [Methanobacteriaceae archaeon]|jgi:hypothetical protein|nr:DUF2098 domain-containing protein [Candidatus Methanorudis spinitermitis]
MVIKDARGKKIEIGSYIRYTGTGTVGKIVDIKKENEEKWLKLEKIDLWYVSDSVEVVDENSVKTLNEDNHDDSSENNTIDNIKDLKDDFEDITIVSGGGEGGG